MVPTTLGARFDDVGAELGVAGVELTHLLGRRDAPPLRGQTRAEDVRDEAQVGRFADGTARGGLRPDVARGAEQLRMGFTYLLEAEPALLHLADQHS